MRPFVVALGLLLAAVVAVDLAAIWKRHQLEPGERMLPYHNVDERLFHKARVDLVGRPRVVPFGSSRVTKLSAAAFGLPRAAFYNAGMGAATVEDFIGVWTLLRDHGKIPEIAVFSIESWQLDAHPAAWAVVGTDPRHASARQATERFLRESMPRPLERVANFSDPASMPYAESEFFDSSHQNAACLSRTFQKVVDGLVR